MTDYYSALIGKDHAAMFRPPLRARYGGNPAALGRSQVVTQRILIPPFPGSNPGAPARVFSLSTTTYSRSSFVLKLHSEYYFGRHSKRLSPFRSPADARAAFVSPAARILTIPLPSHDSSMGTRRTWREVRCSVANGLKGMSRGMHETDVHDRCRSKIRLPLALCSWVVFSTA